MQRSNRGEGYFMWAIIIGIVLLFIVKFLIDLNKDNSDLDGTTLSEKFKFVVRELNEELYQGVGKVIVLDKRSFNLYQTGSNQIVHFHYSTGSLTIEWRCKILQKETVYEQTFYDVRNISLLGQEKIVKEMLRGIMSTYAKHKENVFNELGL